MTEFDSLRAIPDRPGDDTPRSALARGDPPDGAGRAAGLAAGLFAAYLVTRVWVSY